MRKLAGALLSVALLCLFAWPLDSQWVSELTSKGTYDCVRTTGERAPTNYISKSYSTAICNSFGSLYEQVVRATSFAMFTAKAAPGPLAPVAITSVSGGVVGIAAEGDDVYSDVGSEWGDDTATFPVQFDGVPTIRTQHADRATTGNTQRTAFTIGADAQLCVLHPDSVVAKPTWLTGTYVDIGYTGELQQQPAKFFCDDAVAGAKTGGGNCLSACEDPTSPMYEWFVVPAWRAVPPISVPGTPSEGEYSFNSTSVTNSDAAPFTRCSATRNVSTVGAASVDVVIDPSSTAVVGTDYSALATPPATLSWLNGEGGSKSGPTFTPIAAGVQGGETIVCAFSNPSSGFAAAATNQTVIITLTDTAVDTISMTSASFNCTEQSVCTGSATRTNADGSTASVNVGEASSCISGLTSSLSWGIGENGAKNFTANAADIASPCSATITLSGVSGATLGTATATFEIALSGGSGTLIFRDNFSTRPVGVWAPNDFPGSEFQSNWQRGDNPYGGITVATSNPPISGSGRYLRTYNIKSGVDNYRSEAWYVGTPFQTAFTSLGGDNYTSADTYWYGYYVCADQAENNEGYGIYLNQWHTDDIFPEWNGPSPQFALVGDANGLWASLEKNYDAPLGGGDFPGDGVVSGNLKPSWVGTCFPVIWSIKYDSRTAAEGSTGTLRLWLTSSSTPTWEWLNRTVGHHTADLGDTYWGYFNIGGYQSLWRDGWGEDGNEWEMRWDNFTVMRNASFSEMLTHVMNPN